MQYMILREHGIISRSKYPPHDLQEHNIILRFQYTIKGFDGPQYYLEASIYNK